MTDVLRLRSASTRQPWADGHAPLPSTGSRPDVPAQHVVQFYETAPFLLDTVRDFASTGLRAGEAVIVIATPAHCLGLDERLKAAGLDLDGARARGQYVALDAAETLAQFMIDGQPDPARFADAIGGTVAKVAVRFPRVRAFGEMVALLAEDGQFGAATRLERLWNELQETYAFSLLCAYSLEVFGGEQDAGRFERICDEHAGVVPAESFTLLTDPDQRPRAIALLQQKARLLAGEAAGRRRAEDSLQTLFRISQRLHTTLDLDTLLTHLVEESLQLVGAEAGCAGLRTPAGLACQTYIRRTGAEPFEHCWPSGSGLPGWLLDHHRPYITNDALHDPQLGPELSFRLGIRSALSAPILDAQGEVLGFLELHNKVTGAGFTAADLEKVVSVSQVASVAIQNARLYREAQQAVRLRDDLLVTASHELRTPLTTVGAHAQLMLRRLARDGAADPAVVERTFGIIAQQAGKLNRLIEQMLDVSRLEAGTVTLSRQVTDLGELIERLVGVVSPGTRDSVTMRVPAGVCASVDPLRVDQLLMNLLDNAIRYGGEDGPIEIALRGPAETADGLVEIAVRDHGPGIPAEKRPHVFQRFFQAHAEECKSGMGLGLALSRQIAELHGGQIQAEYPPDGGTRFVVRLPVA